MVEHAAVNRGVAGSSPARGALNAAEGIFCRIMFVTIYLKYIDEICQTVIL